MPSSSVHNAASGPAPLTERERGILRLVVQSFVTTAGPVGSRALARSYGLPLSPATIRNTMSDLEEGGYLEHPHTSSGRVPTDRGYRMFVDELMERAGIAASDKALLRAEFDRLLGGQDEVLRESSKLLGRLSNLLGVVLAPNLGTGVLERIEAVPLSSHRVMFVLSLRGGPVRTIVLELETATRASLDPIVALLNERLGGLSMEEIRRTYAARLHDADDHTGVVRLVLDRSAQVFADPSGARVSSHGTQHLLAQPEFQEPADLRDLVRMLEDERFMVQLLEARADDAPVGRALVTIGREHAGHVDGPAERYAVVTARYRVGEAVGTIGVVGPTRMDYARVVGLVEHVAALLSGPDARG